MSTQDFAKIRPEPLLQQKPAAASPAWSLLLTGTVLGVLIGVFACVVLYVSGHVPPLDGAVLDDTPNTRDVTTSPVPPAGQAVAAPEPDDQKLEFDFYGELPEYEVTVNASPVPLDDQDPEAQLDQEYMLQTGAFRQRQLAETEMVRQQILGHAVRVKQQDLMGRTLYLLQSGPYSSVRELNAVEQLLQELNIESTRMTPQQTPP